MPFRHKQLGLALLGLALWPTGPLAAQVTWSGRLGATLTSTMVTDQLGSDGIKIAPGVSPTVALEAVVPLRIKNPVEASFELRATTATLQRTESGSTTDLASMRTFALTAGLRGRIIPTLFWRAGAGLLSYATSEKASIFQDGAPTRFLATAGVEYRRPLTPAYALTGIVRYDIHGFTTAQLKSAGYTGSQMVHRVMVGVGVSR
jgi:hypothetical protein